MALTGLVAAAAAIEAATPFGEAASVILGVAATIVFFSAWEWAFHRYLYHRVLHPALRPIYLTHHRDHHYVFYPPWRFTGEVHVDGSHQAHPSVWRQVSNRLGIDVSIPDRWVYLMTGGGAVMIAGWQLSANPFFCAGIGTTGIALFHLFGRVHGTIHRPGAHPWIEGQRWFGFLERHHYIHHVDPEANENFLVPLADWVFGTLRLSVSEQEQAAVTARAARDPGHVIV
jgi:hypothetical protein